MEDPGRKGLVKDRPDTGGVPTKLVRSRVYLLATEPRRRQHALAQQGVNYFQQAVLAMQWFRQD